MYILRTFSHTGTGVLFYLYFYFCRVHLLRSKFLSLPILKQAARDGRASKIYRQTSFLFPAILYTWKFLSRKLTYLHPNLRHSCFVSKLVILAASCPDILVQEKRNNDYESTFSTPTRIRKLPPLVSAMHIILDGATHCIVRATHLRNCARFSYDDEGAISRDGLSSCPLTYILCGHAYHHGRVRPAWNCFHLGTLQHAQLLAQQVGMIVPSNLVWLGLATPLCAPLLFLGWTR